MICYDTPPSAESLPQFIDELCRFFNDANLTRFIHPIIRAVIIHYMIGYYHPFSDGNGRTARALFYWYMMKSNYWLVQYLSISRIIKGSKKSYEKAYLFSENDGNDLGYFIQYNLDVLHKAFEELRKYLTRKYKEKAKSENLLHMGNVTPRQAEILNKFIDNPDMVAIAAEFMRHLGVSQGTTKSDLKDLASKGYLEEITLNGKTKSYIRSENFQSLIHKAKQ